jgi:phage terminase large subunit-like protein
VIEVAYDKRFAEQMAQNLVSAGVAMVNTAQGDQLNEALRLHSDIVVDGRLVHDGNPVMNWMAANYTVTVRGGKMRPDKEKAAEKIDGQVALTMGLDIIVRQPVAPDLSVEDLVMVL